MFYSINQVFHENHVSNWKTTCMKPQRKSKAEERSNDPLNTNEPVLGHQPVIRHPVEGLGSLARET